MKTKKILSFISAIAMIPFVLPNIVYAQDTINSDFSSYVSDYAADITNNEKVIKYIEALCGNAYLNDEFYLSDESNYKVYAFDECFTGDDEDGQPPNFYIAYNSEDTVSVITISCSRPRYPKESVNDIANIIEENGLSLKYIYPSLYNNKFCEIIFNREYITQKQFLELISEIYDRTGLIGNYELISESSGEQVQKNGIEEYDTEYGMHVKDRYLTDSINGATEITDEEVKKFYFETEAYSESKNILCLDCDISESKLYAFDRVKYDNNTTDGQSSNYSLLNSQVTYLTCSPIVFQIYVENSSDTNLLSYLNETYKLEENSLSLNYYKRIHTYTDENNEVSYQDRVIISGFHYLTKELAEEICLDLIEKGVFVSADYESGALSDNKMTSSKKSDMNYPEKASDDIRKIISESGITAEIIPRTDNEKYITINFPDVENTTQMDIVNIRMKIYKITGLRGTGDSPDYIPVADRSEKTDRLSYDIDVYKSENAVSGDIDSNGITDISDLSLLSLALVGDSELNSDQLSAADIDGNGKADLSDLARLKQYISKVITSL